MIDKKAYDMLVNSYADELLKEANLKRSVGLTAGKLARKATSKGQSALKSMKGIPHSIQGKYTRKANNKMQSWRNKRDKMFDAANTKFELGSKQSTKLINKASKLNDKITKTDYQTLGKKMLARDAVVGVTGTGVVTGGAYSAFHDHGAKSASEMVMDIMEKRASQQYDYDEKIAKSAAELLVEAVMYKQAAYDQMENAQACFDAGQVALDSIGYKL